VNVIKWFNFDDTDATEFRLYRSIPGFKFLFSDVITISPVFQFSVAHQEVQAITLSTTDIDAMVASLNTGLGIVANKTTDNLTIQVRILNSNTSIHLKMYPTNFSEDIGYPDGSIFVPQLSYDLITTVAFIEQADPYIYTDTDGSDLDSYRLTTVKLGIESIPSVIQQPLIPGVKYCVAEAGFMDVQGRPVRGVEAVAGPAVLDECGFSSNTARVFSDSFGRIALPLLQNQNYRINIPAIGYSKFILTPEFDFIDITAWPSTTGPDFSPNGDPS